MANLRKIYFLSPSFDFSPDGPILLGSLLTDPLHPDRTLNPASDRVAPPAIAVKSHIKTNWEAIKSSSNVGKLGVWARFLQLVLGAGAGIGTTWDRSSEDQYHFDKLETLSFEPDEVDGYVERALKAPRVERYFVKQHFRKPVYMVIGIKIVQGGTVKTVYKRANGAEFEVGVDGTLVGAPASVGPQVGLEKKREDRVQWGTGDDFVFAYRLRKIKVHKRTGKIDARDYVEGALFGIDDDDHEGAKPIRYTIDKSSTDAGLDEPGFKVVDVIDDDVNECGERTAIVLKGEV